jgi:hypothetical protein
MAASGARILLFVRRDRGLGDEQLRGHGRLQERMGFHH